MSSASGIDAETILRSFTDRGDPAEPLTAGEVADITGGDREILGERMRSLVERGSLESERVGESLPELRGILTGTPTWGDDGG